jgi:hypothetical protein
MASATGTTGRASNVKAGNIVIGFHPALIDPPSRRTFCDKEKCENEVPSKHSLGASAKGLFVVFS